MEEHSTLGRRIQEGRRETGLSQEALGERLGVSRQAVSKWEADAAVPELESLIAMSRLFGVSIGALLGVEETVPEAAAPERAPDTGLTEQELAAVEAIAAKYMEEAERHQRPRWSRRKRTLAALAAALVLLTAGGILWETFSSMDRRLRQMEARIDGIQSSVSGQLSELSGDITHILSERNDILSDFQVEITDFDLDAETVTLTVSVRPKEWTADTAAEFLAQLSDGSKHHSDTVTGRNGVFTVEGWELPMDNEIAVSVTLTDGTSRRTRTLDTLYGCQSENLRLNVSGSWSEVWSLSRDRVTLGVLKLSIEPGGYDGAIRSAPAPVKADLCLYRNQDTEPERVLPIPDVPQLWRNAGSVEMTVLTDYTVSYTLSPGDTMAAVVRITDDHGRTSWTVLNAYGADQSGAISKLDAKGDWNDYIWKPGYTIR